MGLNTISFFKNVTTVTTSEIVSVVNSNYLQLDISGTANVFKINVYAQVIEGGEFLPLASIGNSSFKIYNSIIANGFYRIDTSGILNIRLALEEILNGGVTCYGEIVPNALGETVSDWEQTDKTQLDYIKNKIPLNNGSGNNSIQYTDSYSISDNSFTTGLRAIAGCKGYYWHSIDFDAKQITLTKEQGVVPTEAFKIPYVVGDIITIINGSKYECCSTITAISNNVITVDVLPFVEVQEITDYDHDDCSIHVPDKPLLGEIVFGEAAHAEGEDSIATERASHAEGRNSKAVGQYSHTEGRETVAYYTSHAEGLRTKALSHFSHTEGSNTITKGGASHAEGFKSEANGNYSHSEGYAAKANNEASHAEGTATKANGKGAHAEGQGTIASGDYSHTEGTNTNATEINSHAEGYGTYARALASHAEGVSTEAKGEASHAEGYGTATEGQYSHAEGRNTGASGEASHAEGYRTATEGQYSHAEGYNTGASGEASHAEGAGTHATAKASHAEGVSTEAKGEASHAEGVSTHATAKASHAEGKNSTASGVSAHAEGDGTLAAGNYSHAEGVNSQALGVHSHAENSGAIARGDRSHAEGYLTETIGVASHSEGEQTSASRRAQHVEGAYNIIDTEGEDGTFRGKYIHIAGNGASTTARSNAYTLDWSGNAWFAGNVEATAIILKSSTEGSSKRFKITIDDTGILKTEEIIEDIVE